MAALCAVAMGLQNEMARRLAVPDLTTSVLTMTLTGLAADLRRGSIGAAVRRVLAVLAIAAGAVIGGVLVIDESVAWGLAAALAILVVVAAGAVASTRRRAAWQRDGPGGGARGLRRAPARVRGAGHATHMRVASSRRRRSW